MQIKLDEDTVQQALDQLEPEVKRSAMALLNELHESQREKLKQMIVTCNEERKMLEMAAPTERYMRRQRYILFRARLTHYDAFVNRIPRRLESLRAKNETCDVNSPSKAEVDGKRV
jgi:hypothetical protein